MPAKVKVRILAARDLPVMDRASDLTDAFAEVRFGTAVHKTDVCRKTLNPQWNSEWFKFEVDDEDLQDEPLQIKVLDHDTYSAHDAIGKLYIDLNPLLTKQSASVISGWFPLYDTMHGIRGELNIVVKVDLFSDFNKFRQSSCGVQFFDTSGVPANHRVTCVLGFIEELVVNDDPEYQWIDKIRTPRASNEARQRLFSQLSGELQRKIGLKVLEMGGNAVLGYRQCFDLEGESGIVVRAIGTCAHLQRLTSLLSPPGSSPVKDTNFALPDEPPPSSPPPASSPTGPFPPLHRRSSDSDLGSPPKDFLTVPASSLSGSIGSGGGSGGAKTPFHRPVIQQHSIDMLEYPFFTIRSFPPGFIVHLGGVVSARSVKLLDRIHNPDEPETRDAWWTELRTEIRSHARAMGCHAVLGYSEATSICDEIIILSAMGTAATINLGPSLPGDPDSATKLVPSAGHVTPATCHVASNHVTGTCSAGAINEKEKKLHVDVGLAQRHQESEFQMSCSPCHVPYHASSAPFPIQLQKCSSCRRSKVPDVLFNTIELPAELPIVGKGCMIQARVCHQKKDLKSEANAKEVSDILPFVEYELHRQLLSKLKVKAMNALFGLKTDISVGEDVIIVIGTATCVYLESLPQPQLPKIAVKAESPSTKTRLLELQKMLIDRVNKNKEKYDIHPQEHSYDSAPPSSSPRSCTDGDSEDELNDLDLSAGNKDAFIIEVDDEDEDILSLLLDSRTAPPDGFDICNTEAMPGIPNTARILQTFSHVWRGVLQHHTTKQLSRTMDEVLQSIYFKLRRAPPCAICNLDFTTYITDENQLLICVTGVVVGLSEPTNPHQVRVCEKSLDHHDDMMFHMEVTPEAPQAHQHKQKLAKLQRTERRLEYYTPVKSKFGIEVSPLAAIPGARIESYIGNLNFFFIRESTSIREAGGMSGFMNSFIAEVFAIMRANVAALGGNALVSFSIRDCILLDNPHKNQGQSLVNMCGDVVLVSYTEADTHSLQVSHGGVSPVFKTALAKYSPIHEQQQNQQTIQVS